MADFGGFNIQTPQEIMAALQQQRSKIAIGGTVQQQRGQNIETALDTVFGNPQLRLAKTVTARVAAAQQSVQPVEGETDLQREMRRLSAVRDAVQDVSPETASQINTQLLKLGQMQLEQRKLKGDIARTEGQESRDQGLYPTQLAAAGVDLAGDLQNFSQDANETVTYMDRASGKVATFRKADSSGIQQALDRGWIEIQKPGVQATDFGGLGLSKPVTNDLQGTLVSTQNQLDALGEIGRNFKPGFLQLPEKLYQWGLGAWESAGGKLTAAQAADVQNFTTFRSNAIGAFNQYIKSITGAAMSEKEADRIQKAFINAEKDSPSQFMGKYRATIKELLQIRKRAQDALDGGLKIEGNQWDKIALPAVSDEEVNQFMQTQQGNSGWKDLGNGVRIRQK